VLAAFDGTRCADFLRYLVQVTGAGEGYQMRSHSPVTSAARARKPVRNATLLA
jgi:hypothetical protein